MRLEYEVTQDDITKFVRHVLRTHPGFRRTYLLGFLGGPVIGLFVLVATGHTSVMTSLLKFGGTTLLFTAFYVYFYRKQVADNVRRAYLADGGPLGKKTTTLSAGGFEEVGEHATTNQKWSGIIAVQDTPDAVYIYNAPASAYIVPQRALQGSPSTVEFLAAVSTYRRSDPA